MCVLAAALLGMLAASMPAPAQQTPSEAKSLTGPLPGVLPDVSRWERSSGYAEFNDPRRTLEYELFVDPARNALYAVTRYRMRISDPEERRQAGITDIEKLQWNVDGRLLRRFECRPYPASPSRCHWVELARDSEEYRRELEPILGIYAIHRKLLLEREQGGQPR